MSSRFVRLCYKKGPSVSSGLGVNWLLRERIRADRATRKNRPRIAGSDLVGPVHALPPPVLRKSTPGLARPRGSGDRARRRMRSDLHARFALFFPEFLELKMVLAGSRRTSCFKKLRLRAIVLGGWRSEILQTWLCSRTRNFCSGSKLKKLRLNETLPISTPIGATVSTPIVATCNAR